MRGAVALCAAAFALVLAPAGPAAAQRVTTITPAAPYGTLAREAGVGGGIAEPPGPVVLVATDGNRRRLVRGADGLGFVPLTPQPSLSGEPDMLPDGIVTTGRENIRRAWLTGPTSRYDHGVLGDAIEASGLALQRFDGKIFHFNVDEGSVFEDRLVRLADLDGDGWDEAIVVQSYLDRGAALAVFALGPDAVRFVSEVAPIGTVHRWLNPAGVADYDGDGVVELAYVETPHIGGLLKLYAFAGQRLVPDHEAQGFSNHASGSRVQDMAATLDWDGDGVADIALPDARRRSLRIMSFAGGAPRQLGQLFHASPIVTAVLPARLDDTPTVAIVYGLADGTLVVVEP
jgi:hypothetical protein